MSNIINEKMHKDKQGKNVIAFECLNMLQDRLYFVLYQTNCELYLNEGLYGKHLKASSCNYA